MTRGMIHQYHNSDSRSDVGAIRQVSTPFRPPRPSLPKKRTVDLREAFEDTVFKPGFHVVKMNHYLIKLVPQWFSHKDCSWWSLIERTLFTPVYGLTLFMAIFEQEKSDRIRSGGLTLIVGIQKWGLSYKVQRRPHSGHHLKWKLTPENPPADTMLMAAMAMILPWKTVEDFRSFVKSTKRRHSL